MTKAVQPDVRVGQVWEDCDPRMPGRRLVVVAVHPDDAYATLLPADAHGRPIIGRRAVRLLIRRMHPTSSGFRLVEST